MSDVSYFEEVAVMLYKCVEITKAGQTLPSPDHYTHSEPSDDAESEKPSSL